MPEISRFYGIGILMYREAGELPARQRSLVEAWRSLHEPELALLWDRLGAGAPAFRIDPLP